MNKKHTVPTTLSYQGRVSLSPEILPIAHQQLVLDMLQECLSGLALTDDDLLRFLTHVSRVYTPGMSDTMFRLSSRGTVYSWGQRFLAERLNLNEDIRRHVRNTLQRCLPAFLVTDGLVDRCEQQLNGNPWDIGPVFRFIAMEMLASPDGKHPLWRKLRHSAKLLALSPEHVTRDDLRLTVLHALYDPARLPRIRETAFLPLRLGLHGEKPLRVEATAAKTQLPVLCIREIEEAALQTLIQSYATEVSHA